MSCLPFFNSTDTETPGISLSLQSLQTFRLITFSNFLLFPLESGRARGGERKVETLLDEYRHDCVRSRTLGFQVNDTTQQRNDKIIHTASGFLVKKKTNKLHLPEGIK